MAENHSKENVVMRLKSDWNKYGECEISDMGILRMKKLIPRIIIMLYEAECGGNGNKIIWYTHTHTHCHHNATSVSIPVLAGVAYCALYSHAK